jgi:choline dehydrogenase-like flavoprotein
VKDAQGLPVARITHRQHPNDIAMNDWFAARILELAQACEPVSAWRIRLPGLTEIDANTAMRGSAHVHGTCRMGADPSRSVLDRHCRAHDVKNLWVVDGSCFPTAGGYNPTLTLLANAYRVAEHFVAEAKRQNL